MYVDNVLFEFFILTASHTFFFSVCVSNRIIILFYFIYLQNAFFSFEALYKNTIKEKKEMMCLNFCLYLHVKIVTLFVKHKTKTKEKFYQV